MNHIWFWQRIVTPHMTELALELARSGCQVTYLAEHEMSADRQKIGWEVPQLSEIELRKASNSAAVRDAVVSAPGDCVHICQGFRGNGVIGTAQSELRKRGARQWVVMETVSEYRWYHVLKRFEYARLLRARNADIEGILATGYRTRDWLISRGAASSRIFPFAYFLPQHRTAAVAHPTFRFIFVGRLVSLKRVDWLIDAIATLDRPHELIIVGSGPEEERLRRLADAKLPNLTSWMGQVRIDCVPQIIASADCLVLPSYHDGWGAVASEALLAGTRVVASEACGVAEVVRASGSGTTFASHSFGSLCKALAEQSSCGPVSLTERKSTAEWAQCLSARAGARYLLDIIEYIGGNASRPVAPWLKEEECAV
jgi:glycosyltransferase involved in cell wall biosynthesis